MAVYQPTYRDANTGEKKKQAIWWIDFTFAGKRIQESTKSTRKTVAVEYEKNRRRELERSLSGLPSTSPLERIASVAEKVKAYLAFYPANHRAKSVIFARQRLAHVTRLLGPCLMCDLEENRIREYIQTRLKEDAGGRTINMEVGELSRAIGHKWSVVWPKVRKLEENHDIGRALSPDEERRLLQAAADDRSPSRNPILYPFLRLALTTGMRAGEIASLRWQQIDFDAEVVTVGQSKTRAGTGRQIPMNDDLKAALLMHAAWYADAGNFGEIRNEWAVFPGKRGRPQAGKARPLDPTTPIQSINSSWERVRDMAGIQCRLHDLRHTAATKMAEAGVTESTMLALMGHMSRAMIERYSHIRMAAKREAVKAMSLPIIAENSATSNLPPKVSPKVNSRGRIQ